MLKRQELQHKHQWQSWCHQWQSQHQNKNIMWQDHQQTSPQLWDCTTQDWARQQQHVIGPSKSSSKGDTLSGYLLCVVIWLHSVVNWLHFCCCSILRGQKCKFLKVWMHNQKVWHLSFKLTPCMHLFDQNSLICEHRLNRVGRVNFCPFLAGFHGNSWTLMTISCDSTKWNANAVKPQSHTKVRMENPAMNFIIHLAPEKHHFFARQKCSHLTTWFLTPFFDPQKRCF